MIIDGNNLLYRAYFATANAPQNQLHSSDGTPTNGVFAFAKILKKMLEVYKPTHLVVALDKGKKSFRNEIDPNYKATRKPAPEDLGKQFSLLRLMLSEMNIKYIELDEYEADDIAGTIVKKLEDIYPSDSLEIHLVTNDKDYYQLCSPQTSIEVPKTLGNIITMTPEKLKSEMDLVPSQIIDLKALAGDPSDNIPGVHGIGEVTATKLLKQYKTIAGIYENIDSIKGAVKNKLIKDEQNCFLSKTLATIKTDVPIDISLDDFTLKINRENANAFFKKYEMNSLIF